MGQWGAFGYAADSHWTYQEILSHFYSDASHPVTMGKLSSASDAETISVVIEENDNYTVTETSPSSFTIVNQTGKTLASIKGGTAARAVHDATTGTWEVQTGASCASTTSWKTVASGVADPVAVPHSLSATAPASRLLTLCEGDGTHVTFRGKIEAYDYYGANTGDAHLARTLNLVPLEQYVADVTTSESPAGWAAYGGTSKSPQDRPWGFQELEAQAVAVRSYVLYSISVGGWYGYADICDDTCQAYSQGIANEKSVSRLAATDTAGEYLVQSAAPAPTEYESSSGGHTDTLAYPDGQSIFTAVSDTGDSVCRGGQSSLGCNPWHDWTASVSVATVEAAYPSIGTLVSVKVTAKDVSGRVVSLELSGEKGSETLTGVAFIDKFAGFYSTLFQVTDGPGSTAQAPLRLSPADGPSRLSGHSPGGQLPVALPRT